MTPVHFSSASVEWATPQDFFERLNAEFAFQLDVCATPDKAKCRRFFSPEDDGLAQNWRGVCWMNPPYGREIGKWVRKAYDASRGGPPSSASSPHEPTPRGGMTTVSAARSDSFEAG